MAIDESKLKKEIQDEQLDQVAGGLKDCTVWYYEPTAKEEIDLDESKKQGKIVKVFRVGYIVAGENHKTGHKIPSRFIAADSFDEFKAMNYGDEFVEGAISVTEKK